MSSKLMPYKCISVQIHTEAPIQLIFYRPGFLSCVIQYTSNTLITIYLVCVRLSIFLISNKNLLYVVFVQPSTLLKLIILVLITS